jgi:hypothetical protein
MKRARLVLALWPLLLLGNLHCGKGEKGSSSSRSDEMGPATEAMGAMDGMEAMSGMEATDGMTPADSDGMAMEAVMGPPAKPSDGPTGIVECDQLLELLCRCKEKNQALVYACDRLKEDAPGKKAKVPSSAPEQIDDERKGCLRALKDIRDLGCQ